MGFQKPPRARLTPHDQALPPHSRLTPREIWKLFGGHVSRSAGFDPRAVIWGG
jgi:hypothetical protein